MEYDYNFTLYDNHICTLYVFLKGCFYYTLGNIRPIYRSHLRAIQLLAIAKTHDIRVYGCDSLLQQFVLQMNQLASVSFILYTYTLHCITPNLSYAYNREISVKFVFILLKVLVGLWVPYSIRYIV